MASSVCESSKSSINRFNFRLKLSGHCLIVFLVGPRGCVSYSDGGGGISTYHSELGLRLLPNRRSKIPRHKNSKNNGRFMCKLKVVLWFCSVLILLNCGSGSNSDQGKLSFLKGQLSNGTFTDFVIDNKNQRIYIADSSRQQIHVFSTQSQSLIESFNTTSSPTDLVVSNSTDNDAYLLFNLQAKNQVGVLNLTTSTFEKPISVDGGRVSSIVVDENKALLYVGFVADNLDHGIRRFDISIFPAEEQSRLNTGAKAHAYLVGFQHVSDLLVTAEHSVPSQISSPKVIGWNMENPDHIQIRWTATPFAGANRDNPGQIYFNRGDYIDNMFIFTDGSLNYDGRLPVFQTNAKSIVKTTSIDIEYRPIAIAFNSIGDRILIAHNEDIKNETERESPRHSADIGDLHIYDASDYSLTKRVILTDYGIDKEYKIREDGILLDKQNNIYLLLHQPESGVDKIAVLNI